MEPVTYPELITLLALGNIHDPLKYDPKDVSIMKVELSSHSDQVDDYPLKFEFIVLKETGRFPESSFLSTSRWENRHNPLIEEYYNAGRKKLKLLEVYIELLASCGNSVGYFTDVLSALGYNNPKDKLEFKINHEGEEYYICEDDE